MRHLQTQTTLNREAMAMPTPTPTRLKALINTTRKHRATLATQIRALLHRDKALQQLNTHRRQELAAAHGTVLMYDSVDLNQIPSDAQAVAGYVGGSWRTWTELAGRFPHALRISIAVNATEDAHCLDVENGDALPAQTPDWVKRQWALGNPRPIIYANKSTMTYVTQALHRAGITHSVGLWVADWTGIPHIPAGYDACQYTDHALGRNLDASLCHPTLFG